MKYMAMDDFKKAWINITKAGEVVTKPGGTRSQKFDRCVQHVKESGSGADPYAVCTAMLGDEAFKSMEDKQFFEIMDKAVDIAMAGPIPNSLMARQDLGSTVTHKDSTTTEKEGLVSGIARAQKKKQKYEIQQRRREGQTVPKEFKSYWKGLHTNAQRDTNRIGLYAVEVDGDGYFRVVCSDDRSIEARYASYEQALARAKLENEKNIRMEGKR